MKKLKIIIATALLATVAVVINAAVDLTAIIATNSVVGSDTITTTEYTADWQELALLPITRDQAGNDSNYVTTVLVSGVAQLNRSEQLSLIVASAGIRGDTFLHQPDSAQQRWDVKANRYLRGADTYEIPFNFMYTVLDSNITKDTIKVSGAVLGGSQIELEDVQVSFMAVRK